LTQIPDTTLTLHESVSARHTCVEHLIRLQTEVFVLHIPNQILSWNTRDLDKAAGLAFITDDDTSTT
jgi:hypothetical protein